MTDQEMLNRVIEYNQILQDQETILWAIERLRQYFNKPIDVVLELGSYSGGTLCMFSQLVKGGGLLVSVDPQLNRGGSMNVEFLKQVTGKDIHWINGKSEESFIQVKEILGERKVDLLAIDSIHTAKQTQIEWELYSPLLNKKSCAFFHDIGTWPPIISSRHGYTNTPELPTGVFWNMLKFYHSYEEKRMKFSTKRMPFKGVGLLFM